MLFAEWYQICELPGANDGPCNHYIIQLHQNGLLKGDDMTERFFRIIMVNLPLTPPFYPPYCYIQIHQRTQEIKLIFCFFSMLGTFCCTLPIF